MTIAPIVPVPVHKWNDSVRTGVRSGILLLLFTVRILGALSLGRLRGRLRTDGLGVDDAGAVVDDVVVVLGSGGRHFDG